MLEIWQLCSNVYLFLFSLTGLIVLKPVKIYWPLNFWNGASSFDHILFEEAVLSMHLKSTNIVGYHTHIHAQTKMFSFIPKYIRGYRSLFSVVQLMLQVEVNNND